MNTKSHMTAYPCFLKLAALLLLCPGGPMPIHSATGSTNTIYSCAFTADGWKRAAWTPVKKSMSNHVGGWIQQADCIANQVPDQATGQELQGKRAEETYSSMVYTQRVQGNFTVTATMSFAYQMAPLIVLAPELSENAQGQKEYAEHFEIVIFNEGVNVWHHFVKEGKLTYRKAAFASFPLAKDTQYTLEVKKLGKILTVSVAGHDFGYADDALPDACFVGVTGCEGLNRFYNFAVRTFR